MAGTHKAKIKVISVFTALCLALGLISPMTLSVAANTEFTVTFWLNYAGQTAAHATLETAAAGTSAANRRLTALPAVPTRAGFHFVGWFTVSENSGGNAVTSGSSGTTFTANTPVYARWAPIITFDINGGTPAAIPAVNATSANGALTTAQIPAASTVSRAGHTFGGWFNTLALANGTGTAGQLTTSTTHTVPTTYYARWTLVTYTITFNLNGGTSAAIPNRTTGVGGLVELPANPTRAGHTFGGWFNTQALANGTGTTGQLTPTLAHTQNTQYFARWTPVTYKITFNSNGGSPDLREVNTTTNGTVTLPTNPVLSGHIFNGWFSAASGGQARPATHVYTADATVFAQWSAIYTITLNTGVGSSHTTAQTGANGRLSSLPVPVRTGFAFVGWFTSATGGTQVTTNTSFSGNDTIYAQWLSVFTITFNPGTGGSVNPTTAVTIANTGLSELPVPSRPGFSFVGWFTAAGGGQLVTTSSIFTANTTIFAQWTVQPLITFNPNGTGASVSPTTATVNSSGRLTSLPVPTRPGFEFTGWALTQAGGTTVSESTVFSANTTVFAQWSAITVTFNANGSGSSVNPTSAIVAANGRLTAAQYPTPTRPGYEFNGWFTTATGGVRVTPETTFGQSVSIYAQWSQVRIVTFNQNYTGAPANTTVDTGANGSLARLPANPERSGFAFNGWFTTATGGTQISTNTVFDSNATVFAQWSQIRVVAFNTQGGTIPAASATALTGENGRLTLSVLPTPTRAGFTFVGWFTAESGGSEILLDRRYTADTTVFARWGATVTFNPNGSGAAATAANAVTDSDGLLSSLPVAVRANFIFNGWFTAAVGGVEVTVDTVYPMNTTIFAQWSQIYTVTFNATGGGLDINAAQTGANGRLTLDKMPVPDLDGFEFAGWFTAATGGTEVTITRQYTANTTLFAQWISLTCVVTFNPGSGATVNPATVQIARDSALMSLPTPSRTTAGFAFNGWFTAANGGTEVTTETVFTANTTVFAQWSQIRVITFNPQGGTVDPTTLETGAGGFLDVKSLPIPERDGFDFVGWFTAATGGVEIELSRNYTANTTVHAQWKAAPLTITFNPGNAGAVSPVTVTIAVNTSVENLPIPTMPSGGFAFNGWYTAATEGTVVTKDTKFAVSTTVYAQWSAIRSVTLNPQGGVLSVTEMFTGAHGRLDADKLPTPTREGFTFVGWYTLANGGFEVTIDRQYTAANSTIHARWKADDVIVNPERPRGDITNTGKVEIHDALEILKYLAGLSNLITGNEEALHAAGVTLHKIPIINDALEILKHLTGMKSALD